MIFAGISRQRTSSRRRVNCCLAQTLYFDRDHNDPVSDVIPAELITEIITERGVFKPQEIGERFSLS
ncbi:MAG: hypothetical protein NTAFB01_27280 [Nitrospira sp.]